MLTDTTSLCAYSCSSRLFTASAQQATDQNPLVKVSSIMKQSRSRDGTRTLDGMNCYKSSIMVEKSYEVSIEHEANESSQQIDQAGLPQDRSKAQSSLTPSTTYRTETSIGRPSTARARTNPHVSVGPDLSVRASQVTIDLHEALRSQLPPFRQSKRWAKTYMRENDGTEPLLSAESSHTKKGLALTCDISHQAHAPPVADLSGVNDNEIERYGLCQPAHLSGWQAWKQRRLLKRSFISADITKIAGPRSIRPRKSSKSLKQRTQATQRRVTMPKAVHSKSRALEEQQRLLTTTPTPMEELQRKDTSPRSLFWDRSGILNERSNSSVSSLHDYEKVKRFSQECVNMLSGLDFGEEWRLSIIAPGLYLPRKLSVEAPSPNRQANQASKSPVANLKFATQKLDKSSQKVGLPINQQSPTVETDNRSQLTSTVRNPSCLSYKDTSSTVGDRTGSSGEASATSSFRRFQGKSSTSSLNHFAKRDYARDMKNTRSVDTLTEIEAQVDAPRTATHHLEKKESSFNSSSPPNRQRPSGEPPGRPLPSIPKDDVVEGRSAIYQCPSSTTGHKNQAILDALELVDPFKSISCQSIVAIPKGNVSMGMNLKSAHNTSKVFRTAQNKREAVGSNSTYSQHPTHGSDDDLPPTLFRSKEVANRRGSKIQEMKKRDVAIWNKSQENLSMSSAETQHTCPPRRTLIQKPAAQSSNSMPGNANGLVVQRCPVQNYSSQRIIPIHRIPSANSLLAVTGTRALSEGGRPAPRANISHRNQANQCRKLQTAASLPQFRQQYNQSERPKQPLAHSQIMVVVDTNPHTSGFRAGALSPSPSIVASDYRPTTPPCDMTGRQLPKTLVSESTRHGCATLADSGNRAGLVDLVEPPSSSQKRQNLRGQMARGDSIRNVAFNAANQIPERTSSVKAGSHGSSKPSRNPRVLDSSDSGLEQSPPWKENQNSPSPNPRNRSRSSQNKFHTRKDTPLTSMLKDEVRKADKELEDLKIYGKRIEYLQLHLEQTMKVWGRMSQNGKRQYLTSTFGTADQKCSTHSRAQVQAKDVDVASITTSSVYTRGSNVQVLDDSITKSFNEALEFAQRAFEESRRVSGNSTSIVTRASTDTDTDGSIGSEESSIAKRTSGGSLTDPHDYDLPPSPASRHSISNTNVKDSQSSKKKKGETLGVNLDDLRTRLQASRPPATPARRCRLRSSPRAADSSETVTRPATAIAAVTTPLKERFAIAPWEEHDQYLQRSVDGDTGKDPANGFFELSDETLRTDQMDAMLAL